MRILDVDPSAIESALARFDSELRETAEWQGWEARKSQRYAIEQEGNLYPPKQILSMATGQPVSDFSGGKQTNTYLENLGFRIIRLAGSQDRSDHLEPPRFTLGRVYDRQAEIHDRFGGNRQSGIARSRKVSAVFLFTSESGEQYGYRDGRDELGVFSYTGEGQLGDMAFTRGNLAIREHATSGEALHLFQSLGRGKGYEYLGEHAYGGHSICPGKDKDGAHRNVIVFQLVPVALLDDQIAGSPDEEESAELPASSLEEARQRALEVFNETSSEGRSA